MLNLVQGEASVRAAAQVAATGTSTVTTNFPNGSDHPPTCRPFRKSSEKMNQPRQTRSRRSTWRRSSS